MKSILSILFIFVSLVTYGFHGSHHSSHHSSSHSSHSSGHTSHHSYHVSHGTSHGTSHSTSHPYSHVAHIPNSHIHSYRSNNHILYYYLLHNKHTNTNDTIKANSQEELQSAVDEVSDEPTNVGGVIIISLLVLFALVITFIVITHLKYFK